MLAVELTCENATPFAEAPDFAGPNFLGWWLEPCGFVTWFPPGAPFTLRDATQMVSAFSPEKALQRYGPDYAISVFHDWHNAQSVEPNVRPTIVKWARSFTRRHLGPVKLSVAPETSRVVAMAITTGTMALRLAGYDITLVEELDSLHASLQPVGGL